MSRLIMPRFPANRYPQGRVVYWIGEPAGLLPVKVGYSERVHRRLREIQIACPVRIQLIAYLVATKRQEKELHKILRTANVHGEWFERDAALEAARAAGATFMVP